MQRPLPPPALSVIEYRPLPLKKDGSPGTRLGQLTFLGGWHLTSNDWRFGGISALHVEGGEATAFSDSGWVLRFPLPPGKGRAPLGVATLPSGPGDPHEKFDRDVEAALFSQGRFWLAFERANAVWRYDGGLTRSEASAAPAAMKGWHDNKGSEAMVRLPNGRFLLFAEGDGGVSDVLLFDGDPAVPGTAVKRTRYRPPEGYRVTDAALLPDGRLLFLNRRFGLLSGFTARLTAGALRETDQVMSGEDLAVFDGVVQRDNLEAVSVTREGGRTILWIASDDNYNSLQRTLLMKFAFDAD